MVPGFVDSARPRVRLGAELKTNHAVALGTILLWAVMTFSLGAAESEKPPGIGLTIVYDTSGSMKEAVVASDGKRVPKFQIANRALLSVVDKLEAFQKSNPAQLLRTSLVIFSRDSGRVVLPLENFDPKLFRTWIQGFGVPDGATPLGAAMRVAAQPLLDGKLPRSHILVVTDGANTV
ncbi:MAG: hypothetical protein JWL90_87, partial [Chthoniobacteraceae bacterium]|nr:hypothetical protein [Chthoniobacteraceae bacterium]